MHLNETTKILFVDDSIKTLKNYEQYFKRYYKYFQTASNGIETYEKYLTFKPDIIFLDINMPKMSGIEVLKKIRENDSKTVIIMLTAHSGSDLVIKAMELKASKYLLKPISRTELKESLALIVDKL